MSDTPIETVEFDDIPDDASELGEGHERKPYRTLLEVWRAVLEPSREISDDPISPQWATKMVQTYPEIRFADTLGIHHGVFEMAAQMADILDEIIGSDEECLKKTTAQEDAQENAALYRQALIDWHIHLLEHELAWRPDEPGAAITLAVLSEVHQMFLGQVGLVAHLDEIGFQYTEDDQAELSRTLAEAKAQLLNPEVKGE